MTPSPGLLPWLATFSMHSALLCLVAFVITRSVRSPRGREVIWKGALLGAFATSALQGWIGRSAVLEVQVPVAEEALVEAEQARGVIALDVHGLDLGERTPAAGPAAGATNGERPSAPANGAPALGGPGWMAWLLIAWGAIAAARLALLVRDQWRVRQAFADRRPVIDERPRRLVEGLLGDPQRATGVRLSVQAGLEGPLALGLREIVLPERYELLDDGALEGLLAHELAHLVRRDPLWSLVAHLVERVFFPQVLLRGVRRRLVEDAELCADDWAAQRMGQGADLARCLATVAGWMGDRRDQAAPAMASAMASNKSILVERVERLLAPQRRERGARALAGLVLVGSLGVVAWAGPMVLADDGDELRLELIEIERVGSSGKLLYTVGDLETTKLERVTQALESSLRAREIYEVGIQLDRGVTAAEVDPLLGQLVQYGFEKPMVVGNADNAKELRRRIVTREPWLVHLDVVEPGKKVSMEAGRYRFDDSRIVRYRVGDGPRVSKEELVAALRRRPSVPVIIDAHSGTTYEDISDLVYALGHSGFVNLSFRAGETNELIGGTLGREPRPGDVLGGSEVQQSDDFRPGWRVTKDRRAIEAGEPEVSDDWRGVGDGKADPEAIDALRALGYVGGEDEPAEEEGHDLETRRRIDALRGLGALDGFEDGGEARVSDGFRKADPEAIDALRGLGYGGGDEPEEEPEDEPAADGFDGRGWNDTIGLGGGVGGEPKSARGTGGGVGPSTPGAAGPSRPRGRGNGGVGPSTPGQAGPSRRGARGPSTPGPAGPSRPSAGGAGGPSVPGPAAPSRPSAGWGAGGSSAAGPAAPGPVAPGPVAPSRPSAGGSAGGPSVPGPAAPSRPGAGGGGGTGGPSAPGPSGPVPPGAGGGVGPSVPGPARPGRPGAGGRHQDPPGPTAPKPGSQDPPPGPVGPSRPKPIQEVAIDDFGTIRAADQVLVDSALIAGLTNPYAPLEKHLRSIAARMERSKRGGSSLADEPLVLRADEHTPFVHIQRVMQACGQKDVLIWRLYLAVGDGEARPAHLPTEDEVGPPIEEVEVDGEFVAVSEPVEMLEVRLRVREPGTRIDPRSGELWSGDGPFAFKGREVEYTIGPFKTGDHAKFVERLGKVRQHAGDRRVVIDPRAGVTMGEVLGVVAAVEDADYPGFLFVGAYGAPANDYVVEDR